MRRKYLREIDRDIAEEEALETERITAEFDQWLERQIDADRAYYFRRQLREMGFDGYDENDPYDRLRSEGGYLGE